MLDDQHGELIAPVVRAGRPGMPKFTLTDDQIADVAAFVHTFRAAGYDESRVKPPSIVVGDAKAGETFFGSQVRLVPFGDRRSAKVIATRIADPRLLQQTWLLPGSGGGRGGPPPVQVKPTTVTVTLPSGEKIEGTLDRIDDFVVALTLADGTRRSFNDQRRHAEGRDSRSAAAAQGSAARLLGHRHPQRDRIPGDTEMSRSLG